MSRAEPKTDYERGFAQGYEVGWSSGKSDVYRQLMGMGRLSWLIVRLPALHARRASGGCRQA